VEKGKYIVIEGHDGTGKSLQVARIRQKLADEYGIESIEFHEPEDEGTPISSVIRSVIKNGELERDAMTNVLLFNAARHAIWQNRALPTLEAGKFVVASRNYFSTKAYQGYGEGLDLDLIDEITRLSTDDKYMKPDMACVLDLDDEEERQKRINNRHALNIRDDNTQELDKPDTFESKDDAFQNRVRLGYLAIAKELRLPVISAKLSPEIVTKNIWKYIEPFINLK